MRNTVKSVECIEKDIVHTLKSHWDQVEETKDATVGRAVVMALLLHVMQPIDQQIQVWVVFAICSLICRSS